MCAVEPPEISYISKTLTNTSECRIIYGLYQKLLCENEITSIVTEHSEAVKTRVGRCAAVITDVTEHSIHSFEDLVYWETDIKVVELNELYIPHYVPLFCIMCHFVKNE